MNAVDTTTFSFFEYSLEEMKDILLKQLRYWKVDVMYLCLVGRGNRRMWKVLDESEYHRPFVSKYTFKAEVWDNSEIRLYER